VKIVRLTKRIVLTTVKNEIVLKNSTFYLIKILFDNKTYLLKDSFDKPSALEIKLNQFVGKKTAIVYREFEYKNDTVFINGYDPKVLGDDCALTKSK